MDNIEKDEHTHKLSYCIILYNIDNNANDLKNSEKAQKIHTYHHEQRVINLRIETLRVAIKNDINTSSSCRCYDCMLGTKVYAHNTHVCLYLSNEKKMNGWVVALGSKKC